MKKIISRLIKLYNYFYIKLKKNDIGKTTRIIGLASISKNVTIGENCIIRSGNYGENSVGINKTIIHSIAGNGISIGNNVGISHSNIVSKCLIKIDDDVMIGGGCKIYDSDFHSLNYDTRISSMDDIISKPIHIKKGAFVGAHSIILKGVTIGEKSIVGAGSVVTKNIPDNQIWAGNPAKFIRDIIN